MTLTPRHKWLQERIDSILDEIIKARDKGNIKDYTKALHDITYELVYVTGEWDKYYTEDK